MRVSSTSFLGFAAAALFSVANGASVLNEVLVDRDEVQPAWDVVYHDVNGAVVGGRNYTEDEQLLWQERHSNITERGLEPRVDTRSIVFWIKYERWGPSPTGSTGQFVAHTNELDCKSPPFPGCEKPAERCSGCHNSQVLRGEWYYVDNCSWDTDHWGVAEPGSYIGKMVTWDGVKWGDCYATGHSQITEPVCLNGYYYIWRTAVKCTYKP